MPTFYTNVEIDVDYKEFLEQCSNNELLELYNCLKVDYDLDEEHDKKVRSESQRLFNKNLTHLKNSWYNITKEDNEIIAILAKKYGAI